jgi:hypothetical protein
MKIIFTIIILLISQTYNSQTYNGPESVDYDAIRGRYMIANSSNGRILSRAADGTLGLFKSGISPNPYGIEVVDSVIYACCGGFIKGYNLFDTTLVCNINTGATFLNGITHDNQGNLFATDFSAKKIYRINPSAGTSNVMVTGLTKSPNGILYDEPSNRLIFVNWGSNAPVSAVSLVDSSVSTLTTTSLSNCDGIAYDGVQYYYVSSWGVSGIVRFNADFIAAPTTVYTGLSQPADIYYNLLTDTLASPNSGSNTVTFYGFEQTVSISEEAGKSNNVLVYPNPFTNEIKIESQVNVSYEITDQLGRFVCKGEINGSVAISSDKLLSGTYFISLTDSKGIQTKQKLLKQ